MVSSALLAVAIALDNHSRKVQNMPRTAIIEALTAEAAALSGVVAGLDGADLGRPSPCPPWSVGALVCHILIAADRIAQSLAEPEPAGGGLVSTSAYYRPDERLSAATSADRIATAQSLADRLAAGGARAGHRARPAVRGIG
jgi:uncharacterized protein (TIGR03083 family)